MATMEPGACVARWEGDGLTVHLPTQFSYGDAMILGQAFGFGIKERLPRAGSRGVWIAIVRMAVQRSVAASAPSWNRRSVHATRKLAGEARMTLPMS